MRLWSISQDHIENISQPIQSEQTPPVNWGAPANVYKVPLDTINSTPMGVGSTLWSSEYQRMAFGGRPTLVSTIDPRLLPCEVRNLSSLHEFHVPHL